MPTPRPRVWISDCGTYYALPVDDQEASAPAYDVLAIHGPGIWLYKRYRPTGFADLDHRYTHAEFPHMVASWTNKGRGLRSGRWICAFEIGFADTRQDIPIQPFTGNVVVTNYDATFTQTRAITAQTMRHLLARVATARAVWAHKADHATV